MDNLLGMTELGNTVVDQTPQRKQNLDTGLDLIIKPIPLRLEGKGYQEKNATNETLQGLRERAEYLKATYTIGELTGIGHPVKLLAQATVLEPTSDLRLIDLSDRNIIDASLIFSALKKKLTLKEFLTNDKGKILLEQLTSLFPDDKELKNPNYALNTQTVAERVLNAFGKSWTDAVQTINAVRNISITKSDALDETTLQALAKPYKTGASLIDYSNVPITVSPHTSLIDKLNNNGTIFLSALNTNDFTLKRLGLDPEGKIPYQGNLIWHYNSNRKIGDDLFVLPVAVSPSLTQYRNLVPIIEESNFYQRAA